MHTKSSISFSLLLLLLLLDREGAGKYAFAYFVFLNNNNNIFFANPIPRYPVAGAAVAMLTPCIVSILNDTKDVWQNG